MALVNDFRILHGGNTTGSATYRREDKMVTGIIAPKQKESLLLKMGKAITLNKLSVSTPCLVRIHNIQDYSDPNPFEFLAYPNYLSYEGAVWDTLGSVWGNNKHPTLINNDIYPNNNFYWEIANPYPEARQITIDVGWLVLEE
ncbi:hypothetical protein CWB96_00420 [Pseudoalteromonas citrea]|uniref:Uncharacterized protein n=1 Tax=Pseudoalteromonas citrea TaxID=43655 RepID=A0A5S3XVI2_9GAMM|nr:hypothetical protein [Pseudoalteromonas citrea]TMP46331.1 hypothetical protein CWB97_02415 [Pseudoalteromonas citrea]TMP63107.1 hypothetical protein CWB96_00420 [Pseudoalteromonas citrea]